MIPDPWIPPSEIRIVIIDDHAIVRKGLRTYIDLQDDMLVVAEGSTGAEAVELVAQCAPDLVLLDLVMPIMDGITATQKIKAVSPSTRILVLTSFGDDEKVFPAIRAGAMGYLLKDIHPSELIRAIREAYHGKVQLHPDIAQKLMQAISQAPAVEQPPEPDRQAALASQASEMVEQLTEREKVVLGFIAQGLNNRKIAEEMVISDKTVKTHISSILSKLGLSDRTQAAIWAIKHGIG